MRYAGLCLSILCLFVIACAGEGTNIIMGKGVYHNVKKGETLSEIARAYNTDPRKLAEINHLKNPELLEENSVVFIPDAVQVLDVEKAPKPKIQNQQPQEVKQKTPPVKKKSPPAIRQQETKPKKQGKKVAVAAGPEGKKPVKEKTGEVEKEQSTPVTTAQPPTPAVTNSIAKGYFTWPLRGRVTTNFGRQPNGMVNNHIRITARDHAPVVAAATGTVIFSAPLRDFGETIIIKHDDQFATVYTNLGNRSVKADSRVKKSEVIGLAGKSGKKGEGYIDFEIRQNNKARNPLNFLP